MPEAHTTLNLLPAERFPGRTPKAQFFTCRNRVHRPAPELCLRTEQVYHKSRNSAMGSCKHNGYQSSADAVICAVPPFLRARKRGGFLEVSL